MKPFESNWRMPTQVRAEKAEKLKWLVDRIAKVESGAWPNNPTFPTGWDERDAKGV